MPIFIKNENLFCYTVHNVCVIFHFFELWYVDIIFQKLHASFHYEFAKFYITSTFITFLPTPVLYSTSSILAISYFTWLYSMSISSKSFCLIFSGYNKERRKFTCDNSLFGVQTLISRFGIATVYTSIINLNCNINIWNSRYDYIYQMTNVILW